MAESTGENFGVRGVPTVRPESALELGGSRVVNGEKLSRAWLNGQNEMVEPIADLLSGLVSSGNLDLKTLKETLSKAYKPVDWARIEGETPETQVARTVSDRFLTMLALRLSGGDIEAAERMLDRNPGGSTFGANIHSLAEFVTERARHPIKK